MRILERSRTSWRYEGNFPKECRHEKFEHRLKYSFVQVFSIFGTEFGFRKLTISLTHMSYRNSRICISLFVLITCYPRHFAKIQLTLIGLLILSLCVCPIDHDKIISCAFINPFDTFKTMQYKLNKNTYLKSEIIFLPIKIKT